MHMKSTSARNRSPHACMARAAVVLFAALAAPQASFAQDFPSKPVRWIVPFAAGGPADVIARIVQPKLNERLGQSVVIDNRAGAASNIGHEAAARATPDGYTMLYVVPNVVTNAFLFKINYDPLKDLIPVAQITAQSYVLMTHPGFAPKNMAEIIALAKTRPVTCASGGGLPQLGCEWLKSATQADFVHVPYKGNAPALNDLIGGQVNMMIDLFNTALPQIRAGKARAMALTSPRRGPPLPDLPVVAETVPGFALVGWHGVMAPAGVPRAAVDRLNRALGEALADPEVTRRIQESGIDVAHTSAEAFGEIVRTDYAKYGKIIRDAGIPQQQ